MKWSGFVVVAVLVLGCGGGNRNGFLGGHANRKGDRELALALAQDRAHVRIEVQAVGSDPKLLARDVPRIGLGVIDGGVLGGQVFLRELSTELFSGPG